MEKSTIALFFLLFIHIATSASCKCKNFENNIYQLNTTVTGFQPFYTLQTLLPNGVIYETANVANGQNAAEFGVNLSFNVHGGYYECLSGNIVHVVTYGYVYKTSELAILQTNGAIAVHYYNLQFLKNDNRQCTGTLSFAFYQTGVNPFDTTNIPLLKSLNNTLTCELLNGRGFEL
jgi:hypothetical protein